MIGASGRVRARRASRALSIVIVVVVAGAAACGPIVPPDRTVAEGSGVEGFVQDPDGRPLQVEIGVVDATGQSVLSKERTYGSDQDGRYVISAPPGSWTITYFRPAYTYLKVPVTVTDHAFHRLDVVVAPSR